MQINSGKMFNNYYCFLVTEELLRTIERHYRIINKGSDSGVGETWCDSLNYCFENILSRIALQSGTLAFYTDVEFSHVTYLEMLADVMGTGA